MLKRIALICATVLACAAVELPLLERFDSTDAVAGNLLNGATLSESEGIEKGALKTVGNGTTSIAIYNALLPLTGGNSYALSLNYHTDKLPNYSFRLEVEYGNVKGQDISLNMIACSYRWMNKCLQFTAPEGATSATLRLKLVKAPEGSTLLVDNLRLEQVSNDTNCGALLERFATDFEEWSLDKHTVFDHFMPGAGGSIVQDAKQAKSGNSFFKAVGDNSKMQYALYIDNISVKAGSYDYVFQAVLNATEAFKQNANGMIIFFFKDNKGNAIGQSRYHIRPTGGKWQKISHSFSVPANCSMIDIGLNLRGRGPQDAVLLDDISFKSALTTDFPLLERFDNEADVKGTLSNGAAIAPDAGLEKGAFSVNGDASPNRVVYSVELPVKGGISYALALNYKTEKLSNYPLRLDVIYKGLPAKQENFNVGSSNWRWMHRIFEFKAPEGVTGATLQMRLVGASVGSRLLVDFLRMAPMVDGIAKGIHITDFETAFDGWQFDNHLIFDHFMPGPGGAIVNEWKEAKVGEAFFRAKGNGEKMQYALYIDNIKVTGNCTYIFEAWYKATDEFVHNANGILIFFYKDANGKAIGQSRFHIRPTNGEWKEMLHSFTVPENCAWLDIGLNMRSLKETDVIQLDQIRLKKGKSEVYLRPLVNPDEKKLELSNALSGDLKKDDVKTSQIIIRKADETKPVAILDVKPGEKTIVDIANYADGPYVVKYEAGMANGSKMSSPDINVQICNSPNWTNELGVQKAGDKAPAPWKDLRRTSNTVSTWNSSFTFDDSMQLQSIVQANSGTKLLVAPLEIAIEGKSIFTGKKCSWEDGYSLCKGKSSISGQGFSGTAKATIDYSGFLHYTIELKAEQNIVLNDCQLLLQSPKLDFVHRSDDSWTDTGSIDLNVKNKWSTKHFFNEIHFGTVDEGLVWYAPKTYPAVEDYDKEWFCASSEGNVSFSLVNAPLKLNAGQAHVIEFAILPYPFRPAEENWKKLRFRAGDFSNLDLIWQTSSHLKYCGSLMEIGTPKETKELLKRRNGKILIYQFPFYIMDNIPEWSYFEAKWKGLPARAYDMRTFGGMAYKGDITQKTWQDYYLKNMKETLDVYSWDGIYYDCYGTDLFQSKGEVFHPTFDVKYFQERIYNVQHLKNKNSLTITHQGGSQANTAAIYSNVILMGEQYRAECRNHTYYMEFKTLDEFRYENAVNLGPDRMFLPQYHENDKIESPVVSTHVMGLVQLHNLMLYPNFINKQVELRIRGRLYQFGLENSTFHPYWSKEKALFKTDNEAVKISYYSNNKGYYIVAFNPTGSMHKVKISGLGNKCKLYLGHLDKETSFNSDTVVIMAPYLPVFIQSLN